MKYKKADQVLPEDLLKEVRKYIQGEYLYISKADGSKKKWGEKSGSRKELAIRNETIRQAYAAGTSLDQLADTYYLSINTLKKIIYTRKPNPEG